MTNETFEKLANAIEAIPTDWMVADTTPEQKELDRQEYSRQWSKVCEEHGVTVDEFDAEVEARIGGPVPVPFPKKFDTHCGTRRSPQWGAFLPDGRQGYDGPNVMCWRRKKEVQAWIDIVTADPSAMSRHVNWKEPDNG